MYVLCILQDCFQLATLFSSVSYNQSYLHYPKLLERDVGGKKCWITVKGNLYYAVTG